LPGWNVKELKGGLTNANWKIAHGKFGAVVRIPGQGSEKLGIDRDSEAAVTRIAAGLGVAPQVLRYSPKERLFITRFIDGTQVTQSSATNPEVLRAVAESLRIVHEGPAFPRVFSAFASTRGYLAEARTRGAEIPVDIEMVMARLERIERALAPHVKIKPIHADMHAGNVILDARGKAILLDWEYAGMGDPFADLTPISDA
jgi:thiamine kinase-like enzyme